MNILKECCVDLLFHLTEAERTTIPIELYRLQNPCILMAFMISCSLLQYDERVGDNEQSH